MKLKSKPSYKMIKGTEYHTTRFKREFYSHNLLTNFWLASETLRLRGFLDYVRMVKLSDSNFTFIIGDFKQRFPYGGLIPRQYKMQLVAEALAFEDVYNVSISEVEIQLPKGKKIRELISSDERSDLILALSEIREIIVDGKMPEQAFPREKCRDCEYRRICNPL